MLNSFEKSVFSCNNSDNFAAATAVSVAPVKALCSERNEDWSRKFESIGISCQEMTGDTDVENLWQLQKADIILTTPVYSEILLI